MSTDIKVDLSEVNAKLSSLFARAKRPEPILHVIGRYMVEAIRKTIRTEGRGEWDKSGAAGSRGGQTLRDTGRLYNSMDFDVSGNEVTVGPNTIYAKLMREGGTIRPVKAKWLTIPIHRLSRRKRMADFNDTYPIINKQKQKGVVMLKRKRGDDIPIFALVKEVTIPGWDYLKIYAEDEKRILDIAARELFS